MLAAWKGIHSKTNSNVHYQANVDLLIAHETIRLLINT